MQEEAFVKSQLVAFCKTLSKVEAPLKQKHVRALVVGTHKLRSSRIFWHAVSRVQLEKNPVLTWKFCQLLHKLIHDGHQKVTEESVNHISRLTQLGNFWQHLRSSGYGQANTCYCKLLVSRLKFHKKYPSIPGNLNLTQRQLEVLTSDVNETFELAIDMLDQMDELLNLKGTIMSIMDSLRWSSLVPQGQCLLSPLILVILDTSKLYDFLVKALFKLHTNLSSDTLVGHRERFYDIFRRTKKFYEETGNLQYFKYLVQIPTLPSSAPNFMQASELDEYQAPQAYLHTAISESGEQTSPDNQSVCDEQINTIIDLSIPSMDNISLLGESTSAAVSSSSSSQNQNASIFDPKDEIITRLQQDIDMERDTKEKVIQEARIRIEQYETRLIQMKQEIDLHKEAADERVKELQELRVLNNRGQEQQQSTEEIERKMQESEQKFTKLRNVYQQLREDHIKALTQIRDLRTKIDTNEQDSKKKEEELQTLKKDFEQISQERTFFESQAKMLQENVQTNTQALQASQARVEQLESKVEYLNDILENEKIKAELGCIEPMLKELPNENSAELDAETMGKQLEEEMKRMTDAIAAAVAHIDELQRRSREDNSGLNLEVNDKILDACTSLMNAVRELVIQSKELQDEIVAHGGGSASPGEFYKRNHQWTEGLISAGRAVGVAATELVKSADNLIMGKGGKFEHLIVAAGSVGASVAQLFVSSRVKSDKSSQKLADLGNASKAVNRCTAMLVGAVKNGQQSLVVKKLLDFSNLSLHETKKEEMESQVKTLELEAELTKERLRLAALRKQHFHLAQLVSTNQENGDNKEQQS